MWVMWLVHEESDIEGVGGMVRTRCWDLSVVQSVKQAEDMLVVSGADEGGAQIRLMYSYRLKWGWKVEQKKDERIVMITSHGL